MFFIFSKVENAEFLQPVFSFSKHEEIIKNINIFQQYIIAVYNNTFPVFDAGFVFRCFHELEIFCFVIRENEETVSLVIDAVFQFFLTCLENYKVSVGIVGI